MMIIAVLVCIIICIVMFFMYFKGDGNYDSFVNSTGQSEDSEMKYIADVNIYNESNTDSLVDRVNSVVGNYADELYAFGISDIYITSESIAYTNDMKTVSIQYNVNDSVICLYITFDDNGNVIAHSIYDIFEDAG